MYHKKTHVHFVGIGGIGMSGIAHILRSQGYIISGCDLDTSQPSIANLLKHGCTIYTGNNTPECNDTTIDVLVYSSAIRPHNPEIIAAQQRGIPTISRALMLAELMRTKYSIAIAGSHGKTTTTSLVSHILIEAQYDPTVIIGGHLKNISATARLGAGDFLVAEADESDRSLMHLHATLAIITNIDLEHLETYRDIDDIKQTFFHFLQNLPFYGKVVVCVDDENVRSLLPISHVKAIKYSVENHPQADIIAHDISLEADSSTCVIYDKQKDIHIGTIFLNMPGRHNISNALAATALALEIGVPFDTIQRALASFKGIERRFSFKGSFFNAEFFDDYGHHPKEIAATLTVARKRAKRRLIVLFQPHRYTRTDKLWQDFVHIFGTYAPDRLIITDIYAASEAPIPDVSGQNLAYAITQAYPHLSTTYAPYDSDFLAIKKVLIPFLEPDDLVLTLGAGKINRLSDYLTE